MKISLKILFLTIIMLALVSCSTKKTANQKFSFRVGAIQSGLSLSGGSFVRAINATSSTLIKLDANDSAEFEQGIWEFQTISFEGPGIFGGKRYCGRAQNVVLSEATKDLTLNISESNCSSELFVSLISTINLKFNTNPALGVTAAIPSTGAITGNELVTIYGTGFLPGITVKIGDISCTGVLLIDSTKLTCKTPAHPAALTNIIVTNSGVPAVTGTNLYTFNAAPYLSYINPPGGPTIGGTVIYLTGSGFVSGATISLSGLPCINPSVSSPTLMTCVTPANAPGTYSLSVTNPDNQSSAGAPFVYSIAPTITNVSPSGGPVSGGTTLTITGTNLSNTLAVMLGASLNCGSLVNVSSTTLTCVTPTGSPSTFAVKVTKNDNQEVILPSAFTYSIAPTVNLVDFPYGDLTGGTSLVISGSGFVNGAIVKLDGISCTTTTFVSATSIICITPAHASGIVDVKVYNPDSQYGILGNAFEYRQAFVSVWRTTTAGENIILPLKPGAAYNFTVNWGDGSSVARVTSYSDPNRTHIYSTAGDYTVKISGVADAWGGISQASRLNLIQVINLGNMNWKDLSYAFYDNINLATFAGGVTTAVTDMNHMFYATEKITSLDVSTFNTAQVTNMGGMFGHTNILTNLNLTNFITNNVNNMSFMFEQNGLLSLDLSNFNTSNVTNMAFMFNTSNFLTTLDLSSFNTPLVTDMSNMFQASGNLLSVNVSSFNTANVNSMAMMFAFTGITVLDLSHFNTTNVTNMNEMFKSSTALWGLNTTGWDLTNAGSSTNVFLGATNLTSVTCTPVASTFFGLPCL